MGPWRLARQRRSDNRILDRREDHRLPTREQNASFRQSHSPGTERLVVHRKARKLPGRSPPQAVFGQGGCYKCYQTGATDPGAPRSASPCLPLRPSEVVAWVASETSRERSVGVLDSVFQLRSSRCSLRRRARSVPLAAEVPHAALESDADCACLLALSSRMNRTDGPVVVFEQPPTQATKPEVAPVRLARSSLSATGRPG